MRSPTRRQNRESGHTCFHTPVRRRISFFLIKRPKSNGKGTGPLPPSLRFFVCLP
ncbi:hypothetical protein DsansV1_C42g0237731 [Dioscorea sansibarensis]